MLKNLPNRVKLKIVAEFNASFLRGHFPDDLKKSFVVPVLKPQKRVGELQSYRCITLENHISKVFQKMMLDRLIWYTDVTNSLRDNSTAYRPHRGVHDSLVQLVSDIEDAKKNHKKVFVVTIDLTRAFDFLPHNEVQAFLTSLEIDGPFKETLLSYLKHRTVVGKLNQNQTAVHTLRDIGVPQGGVLSGVLFSGTVMKQLEDLHPDVQIAQYSDDITVWVVRPKGDFNGSEVIQSALNTIVHRFQSIGMKISKKNSVHDC